MPRKDYDSNRLSRGGLQMLNSTIVLFDETGMQEGKSEGEFLVENMTGISSLIEEQCIRYNFQYHQQKFDCSSPVIIVSTGRSVFKVATPLPIVTTKEPNADALNDIDDSLLDEFRAFFNQVSRKDQMKMGGECSEFISDLFVQLRNDERKEIEEKKKDVAEIEPKTLHAWLSMANIRVASLGLDECSSDIISYVVEMDQTRRKRVSDVINRDV